MEAATTKTMVLCYLLVATQKMGISVCPSLQSSLRLDLASYSTSTPCYVGWIRMCYPSCTYTRQDSVSGAKTWGLNLTKGASPTPALQLQKLAHRLRPESNGSMFGARNTHHGRKGQAKRVSSPA